MNNKKEFCRDCQKEIVGKNINRTIRTNMNQIISTYYLCRNCARKLKENEKIEILKNEIIELKNS